MASNPQAVIEVLGFFAENLFENSKSVNDLDKGLDEMQAFSPTSAQKLTGANVPPPPPKHTLGKEGSSDSDKYKSSDQLSKLKEPPLPKDVRLSGLNDNALLEVLSNHNTKSRNNCFQRRSNKALYKN